MISTGRELGQIRAKDSAKSGFALIKRVWQVDPLLCPRCGSTMKIVSLIEATQPDVIDRILTHCGLPPGAPAGPAATTGACVPRASVRQ